MNRDDLRDEMVEIARTILDDTRPLGHVDMIELAEELAELVLALDKWNKSGRDRVSLYEKRALSRWRWRMRESRRLLGRIDL
jgi:hypothetical protein